jgi:hypothetical protein
MARYRQGMAPEFLREAFTAAVLDSVRQAHTPETGSSGLTWSYGGSGTAGTLSRGSTGRLGSSGAQAISCPRPSSRKPSNCRSDPATAGELGRSGQCCGTGFPLGQPRYSGGGKPILPPRKGDRRNKCRR